MVLDPTTFTGAVAATVAGLLAWAALVHINRLLQQWWRSANQFKLGEVPASLLGDLWGYEQQRPDVKPLVLSEPRGTLSVLCWSRRNWVPDGGLQVAFVTPRVKWLPGWVPFKIQTSRPRVSARGVGPDLRMGGHFALSSSGYLNEKAGAYYGWLTLDGAEVERQHEMATIDVLYEAREAWAGLLVVRLQVDGVWRSAYYPVVVAPSSPSCPT